ncbi:exo-alpha-sialidase [Streptomyces boluensis]|uniref:exo-alpha-sialidase n=1 Tax=Streptomyces boluensis TaxID=1775135 RepID=A0A964UR73_9ACTN|nr:laminin G [Streptomyces boluensis]
MPSGLRARLRRARPRRALRPLLATLAVLAMAAPVTGVAPAAQAAAPATDFEQQVLFKASQETGYACFRIPAVVQTTKGTLLAFAEGRVNDCTDAGDVDLVLKRSTDGGRTWGPLQVINEGAGDTHGNPAPMVDRETGRVLLAETWNPGKPGGGNCDVPCERTPHLQYSDDDGRSWSKPRDLSDQILPEHWNSWYATGPVHGIQLEGGPHKGRLVFGVNTETWNGSRVTDNHAALIHSDDGGDTWKVGATDSWPIEQDGTFRQKPSEVTLTEISDGAIHVSGREQDGTDLGHRTQAVSRDGGASFTGKFRALPDLYAPQVQCATVRTEQRMLLSCPADPDRRRTMMVRSSYDEGRTWESVDRGTVVSTDWSGYSDLVAIKGSARVGLLYEAGAVDARDEIRFARFTDDWLKPRRGPDPTTPDLSLGAPGAAVLGGARQTAGRYGGALSFDGADDAVRLPYRSRLPLYGDEFTASVWFRYSAASGEHPMLWMGGVGTTQPQVWLRGEPESNRITGLMTARNGASPSRSAVVRTTSAHNDGKWHHAVLRRTGEEFSLTVDGTKTAVPAVPGSVSRTSGFGVHVGQRVDSRGHFAGAIDEVRVWNRALSDAELGRLNTAGTAVTPDTVLWLPMDRVNASR